MEPSPSASKPAATSSARVLLGLFILWQLFFLPAYNFLELLRTSRDELKNADSADDLSFETAAAVVDPVAPGLADAEGKTHDVLEVLRGLTSRYAQLTGQVQGWTLFAPEVKRHCLFPCLELRWDDPDAVGPARTAAVLSAHDPLHLIAPLAAAMPERPPELLRSDNEPADVGRFFRAGRFRLRRYEGNVCLPPHAYLGGGPEERPVEWNRKIDQLLRDDGEAILAYLRWRVTTFLEANPGAPTPTQVILTVRRYRINDPDEAPPYLEGPFVEKVARWRPRAARPASDSPLEGYNHVTGRFEARAR